MCEKDRGTLSCSAVLEMQVNDKVNVLYRHSVHKLGSHLVPNSILQDMDAWMDALLLDSSHCSMVQLCIFPVLQKWLKHVKDTSKSHLFTPTFGR